MPANFNPIKCGLYFKSLHKQKKQKGGGGIYLFQIYLLHKSVKTLNELIVDEVNHIFIHLFKI